MRYTLLLCLTLASCTANEGPDGFACTQIGCTDGLSLQVSGLTAGSYTVTVSAASRIIGTFSCTAGQPCVHFIENQTPDEVSVVVQGGGGGATRNYRPEYRKTRPNGPNCPPECKQATLVVTLA
jgi:hypothetical protein